MELLWSMSYNTTLQQHSTSDSGPATNLQPENILTLPPSSTNIAIDVEVLDHVKAVWKRIVGTDGVDEEFLRFEERQQEVED